MMAVPSSLGSDWDPSQASPWCCHAWLLTPSMWGGNICFPSGQPGPRAVLGQQGIWGGKTGTGLNSSWG